MRPRNRQHSHYRNLVFQYFLEWRHAKRIFERKEEGLD